MRQIRYWLGLRPRPRWGSLQRSPRPSSWISEVLLLREGNELNNFCEVLSKLVKICEVCFSRNKKLHFYDLQVLICQHHYFCGQVSLNSITYLRSTVEYHNSTLGLYQRISIAAHAAQHLRTGMSKSPANKGDLEIMS